METRITRSIAALAAGGVILAACGGAPPAVADKVGSQTVVLRMATIDSVNNNGQSFGPEAFVSNLETVSRGGLKVEMIEVYGDGAADAESRLVEAIASGDLDGGWPSTRAFANAGITGLDAVEAPMTITSYAAQKALVSGPVSDGLLARLDGSGVVGLGLAVGPLRRPFAAETPLLGPDDWEGIRFRAYNSPVQADTILALGGTPVDLGFGWVDEVVAGRLGGVEFDIAQYEANGFTREAGMVTANVVLWPKVFVLAMSQKRYDSLTDEQRGWVVQAARQASQVSTEATYDETTVARDLCDEGVRFVAASDAQLAALRTALEPVLDRLADDPESGALLDDIQAIAAAHPEADVPDVPASCTSIVADGGGGNDVPDEVSALPDGTYRVEIRLADVEAAGISNGPGWTGTWTLTVEEGTYVLTCRAIETGGKDCGNSTYEGPLEAGYLRGTQDVAFFDADEELMSHLTGCKLPPSSEPYHCYSQPSYSATWKLDGDRLTFSDSPGPFTPYHLVLSEWQKIN